MHALCSSLAYALCPWGGVLQSDASAFAIPLSEDPVPYSEPSVLIAGMVTARLLYRRVVVVSITYDSI